MWVIAFIKQIIVEWVLFLFFTFTACAVQYARRNPYYLATLIDCVSSQMRVTRSYKSADLNQLWSRKILETTKSQLIVFSLSLSLSSFVRLHTGYSRNRERSFTHCRCLRAKQFTPVFVSCARSFSISYR